MKKQLSLFTLSSALLLTACADGDEPIEESDQNQAWNDIQDSGSMTVATAGTLFPTSYHSEENGLTGYEVELVRAVADQIGVEVEFEEIGVETMTQALNSGRVHLAANSLAITEERQKNFDFSTPYKFSYGSAIVRTEDLSGIETMEDLEGKIALGAMNTTYMQKAEEFGAIPTYFENVTNDVYLRSVENGRGDLVLNDYYLQSITVDSMPEIDVQIHPTLFYDPTEQGFMFAKDEPLLVDAINDALEKLLEDGTATALSEEFFDGHDVTELPDIDFE
ncbi:amino acid ABC transporter, periplasmic amino acid-binding protein [Bacillus sp. JCM 19046]|uniref:Cystine transport system substrate-binding protein n=1 Tax=Shouchella xiaoxiensis TaxID=766895 RepID=A0ABS2SS21_9BACI|nr:transporter substrate-binding domain-containing protein [Shouchella xiaoxiensis]MBM7838307.1 cystine transport system substrate-binding protein [Shouchella xiaoxiensis]GAF19191.1 amino acid ABC transporter, periplasmic amino acid-binding protein [Bacillus sp. JCM 19046]